MNRKSWKMWLAVALLLIPGMSLHAAVMDGAGCYVCKHTGAYFMWTIIIVAECVSPPNGGTGNGIYCHVTVDSGFGYHEQDCEFGGGECLYVEVCGNKSPRPAERLAADRLKRSQRVAYCF